MTQRSMPFILTRQGENEDRPAAASIRTIWHTPECRSAAARYAREMIVALTSLGERIDLICPANYQFREELERNDLVTLHFAQARSTDTGRGLLSKLWTNARFLFSSGAILARTARPGDIVHFQHVFHFPFCLIFFATARLRGCKIVFTVHDPVPHKWLLPKQLRFLDRSALLWAYCISDTLIVHSDPGKAALIQQFGIDSGKITVIGRGPYGLGAGVIPAPKSAILELLLFGSIRENKGIHLAIEAVQRLSDAGAPVRLTIAGDVLNGGEREYWAHCQQMIARDPKAIRVRQEFVPDERLPEIFADCHCLLLPYTRFFSDSGVAFMALASGRPIVATRAGGLGPLIDSSASGVAIEEATVDGVKRAIERVLRLGTAELARQGQIGADYVNTECGWRKVAARTCEVYDSFTLQGPLSRSEALPEGE